VVPDDDKRPPSDERPTVRVDASDIGPSWPLIMAMLERLGPWAPLALRLGTIALLQATLREMSTTDASAQLVVTARELVEAMAHMPWDQK